METKWVAIMMIGICFAIMGPVALSSLGPDKTAERIAACMTQPGMQYVDGDCIPQGD